MSRRIKRSCAVIAGLGLLSLTLSVEPRPAAGAEIIPSLGLTKSRHDADADLRLYGGVALRSDFIGPVKSELGVMYRSEERVGGNVALRMWPVTASLWLAPTPLFYAGGGAGWYNTTIDYDANIPLKDETHQDFGVHLGGGLRVPLGPTVMMDVGGRYVFMDDVKTEFEDLRKLDPDFWTLSLGLAVGF